MPAWLRTIVCAILGSVPGKSGPLNTARRMSMDDRDGEGRRDKRGIRQPVPDADPLQELQRILGQKRNPRTATKMGWHATALCMTRMP